ncbi:pinensin family lanthipeptide [Roseivirga sp. BDSF3-8]|uniref:pinensin family lanthipeptide n=1 Tax=Roseivirga sp. BDSF3-8 TaxID=3241598 RepID=UPI0035320A94
MKKLKLKNLELKSFVTNSKDKLGKTIRGGGGISGFDYDYSRECGASSDCYVPYTDDCPTINCSDRSNCC